VCRCWTRTLCSRSRFCTHHPVWLSPARCVPWWGPPEQVRPSVFACWMLVFACFCLRKEPVFEHDVVMQASPLCWTSWQCAREASSVGRYIFTPVSVHFLTLSLSGTLQYKLFDEKSCPFTRGDSLMGGAHSSSISCSALQTPTGTPERTPVTLHPDPARVPSKFARRCG